MNTHDSGLAHGTSGSPQTIIDNSALEQKVNELKVTPKYVPTKKHDVGGFGSLNPVKIQKDGQKLLDTGYKDIKQIYNNTDNNHKERDKKLFGNKNEFAIELENVDTTERHTLMKLYIQNVNILEYSFDGKIYSLKGNIDELILYLDEIINSALMEIHFPFSVKGDYAIELDINARDYDSNNEDEFDTYYTELNDWAFSHSWTHARTGLYIPDVMYRKIKDTMEISWCGVGIYDGVEFSYPEGSYLISFNLYCSIINEVTKYYKENWLK